MKWPSPFCCSQGQQRNCELSVLRGDVFHRASPETKRTQTTLCLCLRRQFISFILSEALPTRLFFCFISLLCASASWLFLPSWPEIVGQWLADTGRAAAAAAAAAAAGNFSFTIMILLQLRLLRGSVESWHCLLFPSLRDRYRLKRQFYRRRRDPKIESDLLHWAGGKVCVCVGKKLRKRFRWAACTTGGGVTQEKVGRRGEGTKKKRLFYFPLSLVSWVILLHNYFRTGH